MSLIIVAITVVGLVALGVLAYFVYLLEKTTNGEADPYQSRPTGPKRRARW